MSTYMYDRDMDKEVDKYCKRSEEFHRVVKEQDARLHSLVKEMISAGLVNQLLTHPDEVIRGIALHHIGGSHGKLAIL